MKIAFLLTVYTNPKQCNIFIKQILEYENAFIFIHIDKKCLHIKDEILKNPRVVIIPESIHINWGDFSQIESVLELMKYAINYCDFDFYTVNSGHDLLVRPIEELIKELSVNNCRAYLDCNLLPAKGWQYKGGLGRIELYWPAIFRRKMKRNSILRYIRRIYVLLYEINLIKGRRIPLNIDFYGGSDWFTASKECIEYILKYVNENPQFTDVFKHSLIGSEIFFNTLICNMNSETPVNTKCNLRYIDWSLKGQSPGSPKTLLIEDFDAIKKSELFFARKFDSDIDIEVINKFCNNI